MSTEIARDLNRNQLPPPDPFYPESDGQPMADNTKQFEYIVVIKQGLDFLFVEELDIFVAGDLLWYPVEGNNKIRQAPDVLVAFGRPKGHRRSYLQWREGGIAPQVVFEILSPKNTAPEMLRKRQFYERYGVEEYYEYDPDRLTLKGWRRRNEALNAIEEMRGWISPRLQVRFEMEAEGLVLYRPDGQRFLKYVELGSQVAEEQGRADQEQRRADREKSRADKLAAQLRALGIKPEA